MSTELAERAVAYARAHREAFLQDLQELLRIPSVSTLPERRGDMRRMAEELAKRLTELGFTKVGVHATAGHPVVFGEDLRAGAGAPTVLFYGHYDVQPPDPLEEWKSGPFEPTVRGEDLFARGASDMKGQIAAFLEAVESLRRSGERLPVNLKCVLEGEEEIGSPNLPAFLAQQRALLASDFCLNGDGGILGPDTPSLVYGLRGLAYFEVRLRGPAADLHSGTFGGAVHNPAEVLARLLAGLHDAQGRITLPGVYDHVRPLSDEERRELARLPSDEAWWLKATGAPALSGEAGYTPTERTCARPSLDVNGMWSGFTGEGPKTVLPARATAKVSLRLVPDQDPAEIRASLERYLKENAPPTVTWELVQMAGSRASLLDRHSPPAHAAAKALETVWGKPPLFHREGGSVPIVGRFKEILGLETVMLGFGLHDDNLHAPNEKFHLPNYYRGIETFIHFLCLVSG
jgi:acetylornithine deacetylase/succinyl-diaminopimelate desuccinylase-like protein